MRPTTKITRTPDDRRPMFIQSREFVPRSVWPAVWRFGLIAMILLSLLAWRCCALEGVILEIGKEMGK